VAVGSGMVNAPLAATCPTSGARSSSSSGTDLSRCTKNRTVAPGLTCHASTCVPGTPAIASGVCFERVYGVSHFSPLSIYVAHLSVQGCIGPRGAGVGRVSHFGAAFAAQGAASEY
jgi:hypothetical protein